MQVCSANYSARLHLRVYRNTTGGHFQFVSKYRGYVCVSTMDEPIQLYFK